MSDFLATMAQSSAERAARAGPIGAAQLDKPVVPLQLGAFDVIAEIKDRSPAEGGLTARGVDRAARARQYADGGAAAISVLTEPSRFDGSLEHLEEVVTAVAGTPVMRKDFLVDPVQVLEARRAGASGVLLITAMLSDEKLRAMLDVAFELGMFVLLEAFDENDAAGWEIIDPPDPCPTCNRLELWQDAAGGWHSLNCSTPRRSSELLARAAEIRRRHRKRQERKRGRQPSTINEHPATMVEEESNKR